MSHSMSFSSRKTMFTATLLAYLLACISGVASDTTTAVFAGISGVASDTTTAVFADATPGAATGGSTGGYVTDSFGGRTIQDLQMALNSAYTNLLLRSFNLGYGSNNNNNNNGSTNDPPTNGTGNSTGPSDNCYNCSNNNNNRPNICRPDQIMCLTTFQCVPKICPGDIKTIDDVRNSLRAALSNLVMKSLLNTNSQSCGQNEVYCVHTGRCIPTACNQPDVKPGQCPAPSVTDVCVPIKRCISDTNGCTATKKCCDTPCGGSICANPDFSQPDPSAGNSTQVQPYFVTTWRSTLSPIGVILTQSFVKTMNKIRFKLNETAGINGSWVWATQQPVAQPPPPGQTQPPPPVIQWKSITSSDQISPDSLIAFIPSSASSHGFTRIGVAETVGGVDTVSHTFAVVLMPGTVLPQIKLKDNASNTLVFYQDMPSSVELPVTVTMNVSYTAADLDAPDVIGLLSSDAGASIYKEYLRRLDLLASKASASLGVYARFLAKPTSQSDVPGTVTLDTFGSDGQSVVKGRISYDLGGFQSVPVNLSILPNAGWNGQFLVAFFGWNGQVMSNDPINLSQENVTINIKVLAINYAPALLPPVLQALQYSASDVKNQLLVPANLTLNTGFLVSDVVGRFYSDARTSTLGMCVLRAQNSDKGSYQYKAANSNTWTSLNVADRAIQTFQPGSIASDHSVSSFSALIKSIRSNNQYSRQNYQSTQCLLLAPTTRVRFNPTNANNFWPYRSNTSFIFTAWASVNDTRVEGQSANITVPLCYDCVAADAVVGFGYIVGDAMRLGCNGIASEVPLLADVCGVCNGDNSSCVDCQGTKSGTARINRCGRCYGGTTNVANDAGVDCEGQCSVGRVRRLNTTGECLPVGTNETALILALFCDGVWKSSAKIDSCGVCSGGTTQRRFNQDMDACGKCRGDNSTCVDCAGVPNGLKVIDGCRNCLLKTDPTFNTGCNQISKFDPTFDVVGKSNVIAITGAGLDTMSSFVTCRMVSTSNPANIVNISIAAFSPSSSVIIGRYPALPTAGTYSVTCDFQVKVTNALATKTVANQVFTVYGKPNVTSISPRSAIVGAVPSDVYIVGDGFVDTTQTVCFTLCPYPFAPACNWGAVQFATQVVNRTLIKCSVGGLANSNIRTGVNLNISVSLTSIALASPSDLRSYSAATFSIMSRAPVAASAQFNGGCQILVQFDLTINDGTSCADFLNAATISTLGTSPSCSSFGSVLRIDLGDSPTIRPADNLTLASNKIAQRNADNAAFAAGSVTVAAPTTGSVTFSGFNAPSQLGNCDTQKIRAVFQGAKCGINSLVYHWSVNYTASNPSDEVVNDTLDLQAKLDNITGGDVGLSAGDIVPGQAYLFSVYVTDHLGQDSAAVTRVISRAIDAKPLLLSVGDDIQNWNPDNDLTLTAKVSLSQCASITLSRVEYVWSAPGVSDFSLAGFTGRTAKIPGGSMRGGKTYTIKVLASVPNQPTAIVDASISISTLSQDLQPVIARAPVLVVGAASDFDLDASKSRDPDRSTESTFYIWSCKKIVATTSPPTEQPCIVSTPGNATVLAKFESTTLVGDGKQPSITIPQYTLDASSTYTFSVVMIKGSRNATASIAVEVQQGDPPSLQIQPQSSLKQNADAVLQILATVSSTQNVKCTWTASDESGYEPLTLADVSYSLDQAVTAFPVDLVLDANTLKQGATYKFILTAVNEDLSNSYATQEIVVNAPPINGQLKIDAYTGTALTHTFTATAAGFEDEDFPLTFDYYVQSVSDGIGDRQKLTVQSIPDNTYSFLLSEGTSVILAKVCDVYGSCSWIESDNVTATAVVFSDSDLSSLQDLISSSSSTDGVSPFAQTIASALANSPTATDSQKQVGVDIAADSAANAVSIANPETDPSAAVDLMVSGANVANAVENVVIGGVAVSALSDAVQDSIATKMSDSASALITGSTTATASRRRRRAADAGTSSISAIGGDMAYSMMDVLVTALKPKLDSNIPKTQATNFFSTLELVWQGLCAGVASGQAAVIGQLDFITFRLKKTVFSDLANVSMDVSCFDCPTYVTTPAAFKIGTSMQDLYSSWACTDTNCYGGCLATGQLNKDILTWTTNSIEPLNTTRLSDIVAIHFINPSTNAYVQVQNLSIPLTFNIALTSDPAVDKYNFVCRWWNTSAADWSDEGCTMEVPVFDNSSWTATCQCSVTGYFAVFQGDVKVDELQAPTTAFVAATQSTATVTTAAETTTTTSAAAATTVSAEPTSTLAPNLPVTVTFGLDTDYDAFISSSNMSVLVGQTADTLASVMGVDKSRITNLRFTKGSVIVTFDLLPGVGGGTDLNTALSSLKAVVTSGGNFVIGGASFACKPGSFVQQQAVTTVVATTPETKSNNNLALIIGIAVPVSLLLILVIVVVVLVVMKKKGNKIQQSPHGSHTEVAEYNVREHVAAPEDERLYGPAPKVAVPATAQSRGSNGSRGSRGAKGGRTLTPVA